MYYYRPDADEEEEEEEPQPSPGQLHFPPLSPPPSPPPPPPAAAAQQASSPVNEAMAALLSTLQGGLRGLDDALRFANRDDAVPTPEGTPAAAGWGAASPAPPAALLSPTPVPTPGASRV